MAFSTLSFVIFAALSATGFMFGWVARRVISTRREADLQRNIYEAKGAVPQMESALRNREGRITTLTTENQAQREKLTHLEAAQSVKDAELVKRDREIRLVRSELALLKDGGLEDESSMFEEGEPGEATDADARHALAIKKLEARYESLKKGLIQRDDRIAELETELAGGRGKTSAVALELEHATLEESVKSLEESLASRDALINDLQTRLSHESEQRELLEALAKRRSDANRGLKDTAAKLEVQLPKLTESIKAREDVIAARESTIAALTGQLREETAAKTGHAATIVELHASLAARQAELTQHTATAQATQQQHAAQLEAMKQQHAAQLEAMKHRHIAQAETAKHQQTTELETTRHQLVQKIEAATQTSAQHEQHIAALTNDLTLVQQKLATTQAQLAARSEEVNLHTQRAQDADAKLRQNDNASTSLTQALRDRDAVIDALRTDVARLERQCADAVAEIPVAASEVAPPILTTTVVESAADASHPAELQFAAIHEHAAATERELDAAMREMKTLSSRTAELESKRASLEGLLRDKDASLTERARRIEDQQDQLARLEARIDERNVEIAALKRAPQEKPATGARATPH